MKYENYEAITTKSFLKAAGQIATPTELYGVRPTT